MPTRRIHTTERTAPRCRLSQPPSTEPAEPSKKLSASAGPISAGLWPNLRRNQ